MVHTCNEKKTCTTDLIIYQHERKKFRFSEKASVFGNRPCRGFDHNIKVVSQETVVTSIVNVKCCLLHVGKTYLI